MTTQEMQQIIKQALRPRQRGGFLSFAKSDTFREIHGTNSILSISAEKRIFRLAYPPPDFGQTVTLRAGSGRSGTNGASIMSGATKTFRSLCAAIAMSCNRSRHCSRLSTALTW